MSGATNGSRARGPGTANSTTNGETMAKKKTIRNKPKSTISNKEDAVRKRGSKRAAQAAPEAGLRGRRPVKKIEAATARAPQEHDEVPSLCKLILPTPGPGPETESTHSSATETHERAGNESPEPQVVATGISDPRLPQVPTTLVRRDRHGVAQCECTVGPDGIFYNGQRYRSLSGAASAASKELGLNPVVNGYVFFQLVKPPRTRMGDVERLKNMGKRYEEHLGALLAGRPGESPDDAVKNESEAHAERVARILSICRV